MASEVNAFFFVKVLELPGRFWRIKLHQVPHSDCSLRGLPQVPQLPHGLQVFPQCSKPHQHPAPNSHRRTGQVPLPSSHHSITFSTRVDKKNSAHEWLLVSHPANESLICRLFLHFRFAGWSTSVWCVIRFLPKNPCCTCTLTLI